MKDEEARKLIGARIIDYKILPDDNLVYLKVKKVNGETITLGIESGWYASLEIITDKKELKRAWGDSHDSRK